MKYINRLSLFISLNLLTVISACSYKVIVSNGESIYKTGKNETGMKMLDKKNSRIKIVNSCKTCHGSNGARMKNVSIKFSDLANPKNRSVPYSDSLFFRFLSQDLKSDGTKANIGVSWKMRAKDQQDLLAYLKRL